MSSNTPVTRSPVDSPLPVTRSSDDSGPEGSDWDPVQDALMTPPASSPSDIASQISHEQYQDSAAAPSTAVPSLMSFQAAHFERGSDAGNTMHLDMPSEAPLAVEDCISPSVLGPPVESFDLDPAVPKSTYSAQPALPQQCHPTLVENNDGISPVDQDSMHPS